MAIYDRISAISAHDLVQVAREYDRSLSHRRLASGPTVGDGVIVGP
jgi:hypothetical protein